MTKKVLLTTIAALVCLSLSGCAILNSKTTDSKQNSTIAGGESATTPNNTTVPEEEQTTIQLGEVITFNNFEITVNSAEIKDQIESSKYTAFNPDEGNVYITVNITVKNIDNDASRFLPVISMNTDISAKLTYNNYEFKSTNLLGYSDDIHDTFLNPLSSKTGVIAFQVAEDIADLNNLNFVLFNNKEEYIFALTNAENDSDTEQNAV